MLGSLTKSCCDFVNLSIRFDEVKDQIFLAKMWTVYLYSRKMKAWTIKMAAYVNIIRNRIFGENGDRTIDTCHAVRIIFSWYPIQ